MNMNESAIIPDRTSLLDVYLRHTLQFNTLPYVVFIFREDAVIVQTTMTSATMTSASSSTITLGSPMDTGVWYLTHDIWLLVPLLYRLYVYKLGVYDVAGLLPVWWTWSIDSPNKYICYEMKIQPKFLINNKQMCYFA